MHTDCSGVAAGYVVINVYGQDHDVDLCERHLLMCSDGITGLSIAKPEPKLDPLEEAAYEYLGSLHTSMWGRAFDLWQDSSRKDAVKFILETLEGVTSIVEAKSRGER